METRRLPLQNVQKVRSKYWFHLIKSRILERLAYIREY